MLAMKTPRPFQKTQCGFLLIEALISVLVFSVGVLAIIKLQAMSIGNVSDATYRTSASMLANQIIGQMWADDRTPAVLQGNFQGSEGSGGAQYAAWLTEVQQTLPGISGGANAPTVTVTYVAGANPPATAKSQVQVTLWWQPPNAESRHSYVTVTQIK